MNVKVIFEDIYDGHRLIYSKKQNIACNMTFSPFIAIEIWHLFRVNSVGLAEDYSPQHNGFDIMDGKFKLNKLQR